MKQEEELDDSNNDEPGAVVEEQNSENKELFQEEIPTAIINKGDTKIVIP